MKREVKILLEKATDSILLAIEHFNRPWDRGRVEAVLVLADRGFELLLKSIIVHRDGRIREARANQTIGFDSCVRKCVSDNKIKCLTEEQALTIQIVNSLRDAAQHYIVAVSERQLYTYLQSGLTLFDQLLHKVYGRKLKNFMPDRVLLISSTPPMDFASLMNVEFEDIKKLVAPSSRRKSEAQAKLRSFAIVEASLSGNRLQPGEGELRRLSKRIQKGEDWGSIFPGIKQLEVNTDSKGLAVTIRIAKNVGQPVVLVPEGTPGATVVAVKRVDELSFYSMGLRALAEKINLSAPKTLAIIKELEMQKDMEFFKEFTIGTQCHKRYSPKALDHLKKELPTLDMAKIWAKHKPSGHRASK